MTTARRFPRTASASTSRPVAWEASVGSTSGSRTARVPTTLYFTVQNNPPGSDQGFDIYASTRTGDEGAFGPPVLVPELSSPFRDTRTAIRRDGLEIFLSSGRPGGVGSEDLWVSTRASTLDPWSTPVNLGAVVNTTAFDGGPALSFDGTTLYFHSNRLGGTGGNDLYVTTRPRLRGRDVAGDPGVEKQRRRKKHTTEKRHTKGYTRPDEAPRRQALDRRVP